MTILWCESYFTEILVIRAPKTKLSEHHDVSRISNGALFNQSFVTLLVRDRQEHISRRLLQTNVNSEKFLTFNRYHQSSKA